MLATPLLNCQGLIATAMIAVAVALTPASRAPEGGTVKIARGTFEVRVRPQPPDGGGPFARVFLEKTYRGGLDGSSAGQLLGAETAVAGSGGYVALELVTATLDGRSGTFMLQHSGQMAGGTMTMSAKVVPDSGTGGLLGLAGTLTITIERGVHSYALEYTLPELTP
jgi:hypothetical protein